MFRDILSGSRAVFIGLVFFVLVVGGSLLYSWHVHRTTDAEVAETQRKGQPLENKNKTHAAQNTTNTSTIDIEHSATNPTPNDTQRFDSTGTLLIDEASEMPDMADVFLPDDFVSEKAPVEVPVSPFGFGPYPEVPEGYPNPNLWDYAEALYEFSPERARDWELRERVCIKLWKQGKRSESVAMENGLVYPCYPNTVYVRWGESIDENGNSVAYIKELLAPVSMSHHADDFDNDIIPPGVTVITYDEGGIDPYTFLNLN